MTIARLVPGVVSGTVRAPSSKSYTHRALLAGHLSQHRYVVDAPLDADDTRATASALRALGTRTHYSARRWTLAPSRARLRGVASIDCGESGTTLRFLAAVAARSSRPVVLRGRGRLAERPMAELFQALESLGATCARPRGSRMLPATVTGPLHGGFVRLDASRSSQFASALLLTLPTVPEDSTIELVGPIVSEPYIEATIAVLRHHRIRVTRRVAGCPSPAANRIGGAVCGSPGTPRPRRISGPPRRSRAGNSG